MADQVITITIPSDKVAIALSGFLKQYPNIEMDGADLKYTNGEWVREKVRRLVIRAIHRGLQEIANEEAQVTDDDTIIL